MRTMTLFGLIADEARRLTVCGEEEWRQRQDCGWAEQLMC